MQYPKSSLACDEPFHNFETFFLGAARIGDQGPGGSPNIIRSTISSGPRQQRSQKEETAEEAVQESSCQWCSSCRGRSLLDTGPPDSWGQSCHGLYSD